jgi:anaerobic dimethyl sulfoxide reductase subunit B (iron-sulfur subunit)
MTMRRTFVFDQSRCLGCKRCIIACKDWNQVNPGPVKWRDAIIHETNQDPIFLPLSMSCCHCANPACRDACPTGAVVKRQIDGVMSVDRSLCIACDACINACPFDAPQRADDIQEPNRIIGWVTRHPTQKCNFCKDRFYDGKQTPPACVLACPTFALDAGDYDEMKDKYTKAALESGGIVQRVGKEVTQLNQDEFPYAYKPNFKGEDNTDPSLLIVKRKPMKFTEDIG